jgi:hypothetical protein
MNRKHEVVLLREKILSTAKKVDGVIKDIVVGKWSAEEYPEKLTQVLRDSFSDPLEIKIAAGLFTKKADEISKRKMFPIATKTQINFIATEALKMLKN